MHFSSILGATAAMMVGISAAPLEATKTVATGPKIYFPPGHPPAISFPAISVPTASMHIRRPIPGASPIANRDSLPYPDPAPSPTDFDINSLPTPYESDHDGTATDESELDGTTTDESDVDGTTTDESGNEGSTTDWESLDGATWDATWDESDDEDLAGALSHPPIIDTRSAAEDTVGNTAKTVDDISNDIREKMEKFVDEIIANLTSVICK